MLLSHPNKAGIVIAGEEEGGAGVDGVEEAEAEEGEAVMMDRPKGGSSRRVIARIRGSGYSRRGRDDQVVGRAER